MMLSISHWGLIYVRRTLGTLDWADSHYGVETAFEAETLAEEFVGL